MARAIAAIPAMYKLPAIRLGTDPPKVNPRTENHAAIMLAKEFPYAHMANELEREANSDLLNCKAGNMEAIRMHKKPFKSPAGVWIVILGLPFL